MKKFFVMSFLIITSCILADTLTRDDAIKFYKSKSKKDSDIVFLSIRELSNNVRKEDTYESIGLASKNVTDEDLKYIMFFPELEALHLSGARITDGSLKYFYNFQKLKILNIDDTNITDAGLKHLKDLKSLKELDLFNTKVTDKGIQELASVKSLTLLMLHGTKVTQKGIDELKKKLPNCYITLESREELQ